MLIMSYPEDQRQCILFAVNIYSNVKSVISGFLNGTSHVQREESYCELHLEVFLAHGF